MKKSHVKLNNKSNSSSSINSTESEDDQQKLTLPNMIKDIVFFYIKHYYDKYLVKNQITILTDKKIEEFITENYVNKQIKIKKYIRDSLKKNLGDEYNGITVENILLEIFNDDILAQERLRLEIKNYQDATLS
jgi:hypothetical protein